MKREWTWEELADVFWMTPAERNWVSNVVVHNPLGLAIMLKVCQYQGRFPDHPREVVSPIVTYLAQQVERPTDDWATYDWTGRTAERHRQMIRERVGFRPATTTDVEDLVRGLTEQPVLSHDHDLTWLKDLASQRLFQLRMGPPTPDRIERAVRSAIYHFEQDLFASIFQAMPARSLLALDQLVTTAPAEETEERTFFRSPLLQLKRDPARMSLQAIMGEVEKLEMLQVIELPDDLFSHLTPKLISKYRQRAAAEPPCELRNHPAPVKYTLLAAFCWQRRREVTDNLVDLLHRIIHKMHIRAEQRVEAAYIADIKRVHGKQTLLFRLAEAALDTPDKTIRKALFPVVSETILRDLVEEFRASGVNYHSPIHHRIRSSYSHHYRRMLPHLRRVLTFRSSNTTFHPVIDAIEILRIYLGSQRRAYPFDETIPIEGVVPPNWQTAVIDYDQAGNQRINRINYEVCVLHALREKLRNRTIWVEGSDRYRNPDEDTLADYDDRRSAYYAALNQPLDAITFTQRLQAEMDQQLAALDESLPTNPHVEILSRGNGWIKLSPLLKQPEPPQLFFRKSEVAFAFCHLLGFDLLPRLNGIHRQKLYRPRTGHPQDYPNLQLVLSRPINWRLIQQQYDDMIRFAASLFFGTADADTILRRFTRSNLQHPTYQALADWDEP